MAEREETTEERIAVLRKRGDFLGAWYLHRETYPDEILDQGSIDNRNSLIAEYEARATDAT
jgi:hypothetical protein